MPRRKIPKKAELIQLQKLYKTDDKIAERLGNVSPQLVAYWRRKKNIPRHSFSKFSPDEIRELWERYGDDYRCGLELGISKAAFYNWRRKYGFKEKPAFLKLEQLELNLGGPEGQSRKKGRAVSMTIAQKILTGKVGLEKTGTMDAVEVEPDITISSGDAGEVIGHFIKSGLSYVWNPNRIIITLSGRKHSKSNGLGNVHKEIRDFARRQNFKYFYEMGEGSCHQIIVEKGHILPGQLALGSCFHTTSCGCIGALGLDLKPADLARVWASGKITLKIPQTIKIAINGRAPSAVFARDVILFVIKKLGDERADGKVIEFYGTAVSQMSISERFTLTNLVSELGAAAALVPYDSITRRYLSQRTNMPYRPALADRNAEYLESYEFNIDRLVPQIACPQSNDGEAVADVSEREGIPVEQVIIGSDANGRFDDLRVAADVIKGKKINQNVRMLVYPGSRSIYLEALKRGLIRAFVEAGALIMFPGEAPDPTDNGILLAPGETCLATTNQAFRDLNEPSGTKIYLASPATAAASALKGVISNPTGYLK